MQANVVFNALSEIKDAQNKNVMYLLKNILKTQTYVYQETCFPSKFLNLIIYIYKSNGLIRLLC